MNEKIMNIKSIKNILDIIIYYIIREAEMFFYHKEFKI